MESQNLFIFIFESNRDLPDHDWIETEYIGNYDKGLGVIDLSSPKAKFINRLKTEAQDSLSVDLADYLDTLGYNKIYTYLFL